jgi:hypothetical protein
LILGALFVLLPCRESSAQIPDAVYADARKIIEDLLTRELAESVVPALACRAGRRAANADDPTAINAGVDTDHPTYVTLEATRYFPRTLQHIYSRQYGTLRTTIRDEAAELAADLVYDALIEAGRLLPQTAPSGAFLTAQAQTEKAIQSTPAGTVQPSAPAASMAYITFTPLNDAQLLTCVTSAKDKFDENSFGDIATYPLDQKCETDGNPFACGVAQGVRAILLGKPGDAQDALVRAVSGIVTEHLRLALESVPGIGKSIKPFDQELALLIRQYISAESVDPTQFAKDVADLLDRRTGKPGTAAAAVATVLAGIDEFRAYCRMSSDFASGKLNPLALLKSAATAGTYLGNLCALSDSKSCQVVKALGIARPFNGATPKPTAGIDATYISRLRQLLKYALPIVEFAGRGEYRQVASIGIRYVFEKFDPSSDSERGTGVYQRFAESIVMYVLDAADDKAPSEATREAFRNATVDLIHQLGKGGGVNRRAFSAGHWGPFRMWVFAPVVLPDFALRASWSPSYVNVGDNTVRIIPSVNWINLRIPLVRVQSSYLAVEFSVIDPLAPLSELVVRRTQDVQYFDSGKQMVNVITPRLETLFGVPALSEHLVVSAGASLRMSAPFRDHSTPCAEDKCYRYQYIWEHRLPGDTQLRWPSFVEYGFSAKYVL